MERPPQAYVPLSKDYYKLQMRAELINTMSSFSLLRSKRLFSTMVNEQKKINKIALSFAMIEEAMPLIQRLSLKESTEVTLDPFIVYKNEKNSIYLVANGKNEQYKCDRVGTQWSMLSTYLTLTKLSPDIMINAGTCGGVLSLSDNSNRSGMNIADVYIGERVIYSDRRIPIEPWKGWDIGNYELFGAEYLSEKIERLKIAKCISTSNAFDCTQFDDEIYEKYDVMCKEMECAAVAEMCKHFDCKLIALKAVSDFVKYGNSDDFIENFNKTVNALAEVTEEVICQIDGKYIAEISNERV